MISSSRNTVPTAPAISPRVFATFHLQGGRFLNGSFFATCFAASSSVSSSSRPSMGSLLRRATSSRNGSCGRGENGQSTASGATGRSARRASTCVSICWPFGRARSFLKMVFSMSREVLAVMKAESGIETTNACRSTSWVSALSFRNCSNSGDRGFFWSVSSSWRK